MTHQRSPWVAPIAPIFVLAALLTAGCGSVREARFTGLTPSAYPAREVPAAVAEAGAETLPGKGYVLVGIVEARAPVRLCSASGCVAADVPPDPTGLAQARAARAGGDLIVLELDAVLVREPIEERGECLHMIGAKIDGDSLCAQWEWEHSVRESLISRGTVWRLEPDQARNGANALARHIFGESPD